MLITNMKALLNIKTLVGLSAYVGSCNFNLNPNVPWGSAVIEGYSTPEDFIWEIKR